MTQRGWILFLLMAVIWGIPYLLIKVAVGELTPATLVFFRTLIGAAILLPLALRAGLRQLLPYWKPILAYTFVEVAAPWLLLSDAERRISSSLAGLLIAGVPLVGAFLGWLTRSDDRLDARRVAGLGIGLLGVALLVGLEVSGDLWAVVEVGLVTVGYAIGPMIIVRRLSALPAVGVVWSSLAVTGIAYAPLALVERPAALPSLAVILSVAGLGIVCTAIAFLLFFALIAEVGPIRATVITYFNPAVALVLGVAVLGEPLTAGIVAGFLLIAVGSYLATRRAAPAPVPSVAT